MEGSSPRKDPEAVRGGSRHTQESGHIRASSASAQVDSVYWLHSFLLM